jgi:hypothetical protein
MVGNRLKMVKNWLRSGQNWSELVENGVWSYKKMYYNNIVYVFDRNVDPKKRVTIVN